MRDNQRTLRRRKVERELKAGIISRKPPSKQEAEALRDAICGGRFQELSLAKLAPVDVDSPYEPYGITFLEFAAAGDGRNGGVHEWKPRLSSVQALLKAGASPSPSVPEAADIVASVLYPQARVHIVVRAARMRALGRHSEVKDSNPCCSCGAANVTAVLHCPDCGEASCERCFWEAVRKSCGAAVCAAACRPPEPPVGFAAPPQQVRSESLAKFLALPADRGAASKSEWDALAPRSKDRSAPLEAAAALLPGPFQAKRTENLHAAALSGCPWRLRALVEAGVDVDAADEA
eukprot:CAMPEP_0177587272 /NCGR_PEP_ID=MMETSP0419_2-20121207/5546_1 /TAXON_ID=582737 /ORGANISM="Tetraselmis sp., Strain GSL018" /LENGTH=290 /DNA_ID=CAMNT_0019077277 /DNA_START=154 /DNA_END=1022 /DNA_ORIENTATION=-